MPAPRGTVALAFTDIEGSTKLWERHGDAFRPVLERHHAVLREAILRSGGHEVKTEGDAFMVAFPSASAAAAFALEAQEGLAREVWPADVGEVKVRIGVHLGEPIFVEDVTGRADYLGPVVNRAARISQAAHGGQILMSEAVHSAAAGQLSGAALVDLGEHRLRGLERPERLWQALPKSLSARRFPPPVTLTGAATNIPAPANSFVGREREVREISALLGTARLVTLTGPGGTGKTRLSLRIGAEVLDRFPGGVWFADLTEARDAAGVSEAVARALGTAVTGRGAPESFVADLLEFRGGVLLILDNFEQVVDAAPATVAAWLGRAPQLRVLATSRFLLNIAGEREVALGALPSPAKPGVTPTIAEVASHDATRLFVERAREADPAFELTSANASDIAALCAELEGMPLALELAAARIRILSPAQILARLSDRFKLLTSARRDQTARQRSLSGAIEWSWGLLEDWERSAFAQLCVFRGGFDVEGAEAVLDLVAFRDAPPAMDVVQRLRERSFLRGVEIPSGQRFNIYVALREFGDAWRESRAVEAERRSLIGRFAGHFRAFAESWGSRIPTARAAEALDRLESERDNLLAASECAKASGDGVTAARIESAMALLFARRGPWNLRVQRLGAALEALSPHRSPLRATLRARFAEALWDNAESARAVDEASRAVEEARAIADRTSLAEALDVRASILLRSGDSESALKDREEVISLCRKLGDRRGLALALASQALHLLRLGDPSRARATIEEAEQHARAAGDPWALGRVLGSRGHLVGLYADHEGAAAAVAEAEILFRSVGDIPNAARMLATAGQRLTHGGDAALGERKLRQAEVDFSRTGTREGLAMVLNDLAVSRQRHGDLDGALELLGRAEEVARKAGVATALALILSARGGVLTRKNDLAGAMAAYDEAEPLLRSQRNERQIVLITNGRARVLFQKADYAAALKLYGEGLATSRGTGDVDAQASFLFNQAHVLEMVGSKEEALSRVLEAEANYRKCEALPGLAAAMTLRSRLLHTLGRDRESLEVARECFAVWDRTGLPYSDIMAAALTLFLEVAVAVNEPEALREGTDRARKLGWVESPPDDRASAAIRAAQRMTP